MFDDDMDHFESKTTKNMGPERKPEEEVSVAQRTARPKKSVKIVDGSESAGSEECDVNDDKVNDDEANDNGEVDLTNKAPSKKEPTNAKLIAEHHELLRDKLNEERGAIKVPMRFLQEYLREEKIDTEAFLTEDSFLTKKRHKSVDPNSVYDEFNPIFKKNVMN